MKSAEFKHQFMQEPARFIGRLTRAETVGDSWGILQETLQGFGFDRLLYGKKYRATRSNLHNHGKALLLSSYGVELDKNFLESRLYMNSPTIMWALNHYGCKSWGDTAQKFEAGELSKAEVDVVEITRAMGLNAGLTYSIPTHTEAYRSSIGMAFQGTQVEADSVWNTHHDCLEQIILVFDIAMRQYAHIPEGQRLDDRTLRFMSWIAEGRSQAEIADLEGCHARTVDSRLAAARKTLGASNSLEAVLIAKLQGQF